MTHGGRKSLDHLLRQPPEGAGWRSALATGVATAALRAYGARPVRAQTSPPASPCNEISGTLGEIVTCSGNLSSGVRLTNGGGVYSVLNVNNLTTNIAPASGVSGIEFTSNGAVDLNIHPHPFVITTTDADGVFAASNGGTVTISSTADITTSGNGAVGIIGSGQNDALTLTSSGNIATSGNNSFGIAAGTIYGAVTVTSTGNIATTGTFAAGINVGTIGGAITINSTGDIATSGNSAIGINAASVYGAIAINTSGSIAAAGSDADGISAAGASSAVTIASGTVSGGSGAGAGVRLNSTGANTLTNHGSIAALSGLAAASAGGNDTVHNYGTITGNVDLGTGTNVFNNRAGALFNAGDTVEVGTLNNAGTFAPGGVGAIETTNVSDDMVQTSTGVLAIDIGSGGTSDQVVVSDTAVLAGTVAVNVLSLSTVAQQFTILQALTSVTNNGLALSASPALHASLAFTATTVLLTTSIDFALSGLSLNEHAIGANLNSVLAAGGGSLAPLLLALLNTSSLEAYENALNQLSPELYSDAQIAALYATLGFSKALLSCRVNGTDTASIIREGQCLWAGASARFLDSGSTFNQIGFTETAGLFAAGTQVAIDDVWRIGIGAAYQSSWLKSATNATSEGEQAQAGLAVKYNPGPLLLAGVLNGGRGWYDTTRPIAFGGFAATAQSDSAIDVLNGGMRAAYVFGSPQLYFKPMLDADVTRLALGGFTETGGGAANLVVQGQQQTVYTVAPTVEVGTEWWLANGTLVRPFLRAGAVWYGGGDLALSAGFLGAPAGVAPFTILTDMDDLMGVVGAGLDVINTGDTALRLGYDGQLGETTQIHSVGLKGSASF